MVSVASIGGVNAGMAARRSRFLSSGSSLSSSGFIELQGTVEERSTMTHVALDEPSSDSVLSADTDFEFQEATIADLGANRHCRAIGGQNHLLSAPALSRPNEVRWYHPSGLHVLDGMKGRTMDQSQPRRQPDLPSADAIRTAPSFKLVRKGFDQEQVFGHLRLVGQRVSDLELEARPRPARPSAGTSGTGAVAEGPRPSAWKGRGVAAEDRLVAGPAPRAVRRHLRTRAPARP